MARTQTDLEKVRGDQSRWRVTVTDSAVPTPAPIDLSAPVVIRFTVKRRLQDVMAEALVALATYDSSEILITDAINGEYLATIKSGVDARIPPGNYCWDSEVIRGGATLKASPGDGVVAVVNGSGILTFSDASVPPVADIGEILNAQGLDVAITWTPATKSTLAPNQLETDYLGWTTDPVADFTLYEGDVKTPDKLSGEFALLADVTN